ncbi:MAG TPA: hypothetical protein DCM05_03315 [Elusimicrobia bacterium]|nr:hypothetical protein [Elusimicrobiota bacterium]
METITATAKKNTLQNAFAQLQDPLRAAYRQGGAERLIGEKLLNYVGMLLIVLGGAFFLKYTIGMTGPWGKLAIGFLSGAGLVALGEWLNHDERYAPFSLPLIGGGWSLLYYTAFAAHYLPASKVIGSATLELILLCATAGGMILHSMKTRSRLLTAFAFGIAYFVFALTHLGIQTLTVCSILALAGAFLVGPLQSPELAAINLAGFYLNYFPVFKGVLGAGTAGALPAGDFWLSVGAAAVVHAAYALMTPLWRAEEPDPWMDSALSFSAVLYAAAFYGQLHAFAPAHGAAGLLALAALLTGLSAARGGKASALTQVQAFLGAAVLVLAVIDLPGPVERSWGLALSASVLGTLGIWLDRNAFEKYGFAMLILALSYAVTLQPLGPALRAPVAMSLAYLGVAGYALAGLRESASRVDARLGAYWLYGGFAALIIAFWTYFHPAAYVVALFALALALEWAAAQYDQPHLLHQALLLEVAAGVCCLFVDYGANLPVLGWLTPRLMVKLSVTGAYAAAVFGRRAPEGSFLGIDYNEWRKAECWLMCLTAAFGQLDIDPHLRLPVAAAGAVALLGLGRSRSEDLKPLAPTLRTLAVLAAPTAAAAGVCTYLLAPMSLGQSAAYASAALFLLVPLFWGRWAQTEEERKDEKLVLSLYALLSAGLLAAFVRQQAAGAYITLGWSLVGVSYLVAGLGLRKRALRLPGLGLLGLCVMKALFVDLTALELPYRVLSYTVLGALLLLSSYLYVRSTDQEDSDEA